MSKDVFANIRLQAIFCEELMRRVSESIRKEKTESSCYGVMRNHTQKMADIRRLRRELLELHKMLDPWRKEVQE